MDESLFTLLDRATIDCSSRPAISFGETTCSYAGLRDKSLRLANLLSEHGARPGERIAFCFRKSVDALVAMFGIIRTGAAYVPLDPTWPVERMQMICDDSGIRIWTGTDPPIGITGIVKAFTSKGSDVAIPLARVNEASPMVGDVPSPSRGIANILFTSGSTGRPKGVEITTRSLLHFSQWVVDEFQLGSDDRVAGHAPYNFDLSTLDIFAAVRAGACMCPVPERLKMFPYQMAKFIADEKISVWYSVPSALIMMQLRGKLGEHDFSSLRHVIFAGEVMPKPALQAIAGEIPHATFTNLYGPTETNVCTYHRCGPADLSDDGPVPIGRAISDTNLWIVNDGGAPLPAGLAGELLVAGPTVTTGYHGDSEKTAERLVTAPDGREFAYRTGDRVRRRDDGVLMFEGRIDRMIKCRGHRIEPGEIEAALARHPSVKEVAIVPMPDPVFGNRIRACLAARDGKALAESDLVSFCRDRLPTYMMPDEWAFFAELPRTDREKIDLQKLASR
jgi:amino acid adenylation domain-containing protein